MTVWPEHIAATSIELDTTKANLKKGSTLTLKATMTPVEAEDTIVWSSSNEEIATVDQEGVVTGVAGGDVVITAKANDSVSATCEIHVYDPKEVKDETESGDFNIYFTSLKNSAYDAFWGWGDFSAGVGFDLPDTKVEIAQHQFTPIYLNFDTDYSAYSNWNFNSYDSFFSITAENFFNGFLFRDHNGTIQSGNVEFGNEFIPVADDDGNYNIYVVEDENGGLAAYNTEAEVNAALNPIIDVTEVKLDKTELTLTEGETGKLNATVLPENASDKTLTWTSSDSTLVSVAQDGTVTAVKEGTATITATSNNGKTAACTVTVKPVVTNITLDKTEETLSEGESLELTATLTPTDVETEITWTSSDESIAKVSGEGLKATVTAVKAGDPVTITAATSNGLKATCTVTVTAAASVVSSVTIDETATVKRNEQVTLTATVAPETANQLVTWSSSNERVATVDENGVVTGVSVGEATITATSVANSEISATCSVTVTSADAFSPSEETSPKDLNIYYTSTQSGADEVTPEELRNYAYVWNDQEGFVAKEFKTSEKVQLTDGTTTVMTLPVYIDFGQEYVVGENWNSGNNNDKRMTFNSLNDLTHIIFKDVDSQSGNGQSGDANIETEKVQTSADGTMNIYIIEDMSRREDDWQDGMPNYGAHHMNIYYTLEDFLFAFNDFKCTNTAR